MHTSNIHVVFKEVQALKLFPKLFTQLGMGNFFVTPRGEQIFSMHIRLVRGSKEIKHKRLSVTSPDYGLPGTVHFRTHRGFPNR